MLISNSSWPPVRLCSQGATPAGDAGGEAGIIDGRLPRHAGGTAEGADGTQRGSR